MWLRFLTFCVLVSLILIAVLSTIYGRPVINIFFKRCCGNDIENDHGIFENFNENSLMERLVSDVIIYDDAGSSEVSDNGTVVRYNLTISDSVD